MTEPRHAEQAAGKTEIRPSRSLRCECCSGVIKPSEIAAVVWNKRIRKVWCFPCWDHPDEVALGQYRRASL